jgi:hypothetical protein
MFSIDFIDQPLENPYDDSSVPAAPGRVVLGNTEEEFLANLSTWGKSEYKAHWTRQLRALLEGNPKVALVVSYGDPKVASNIEIWRIYREGEWAHFQNQLLAYSNLPDNFEVSKIEGCIPDRTLINEDGNRISEWDVPIRDIERFLWDG